MSFAELVAWANENDGFMMGLLTALYLIATLWIVFESRRTNRLQAAAIKQAADLETDRNRPYVVFNVDSRIVTHSDHDATWYFEAVVMNIGKTSAHNIHIRTTPDFSAPVGYKSNDELAYRKPSILDERISMMPPGYREVEQLGPTHFLFKVFDRSELKFQVYLNYEASDGTQYKDDYTIHLGERAERLGSADPMAKLRFREVDTLDKISQNLDQLNRILDAPDRGRLFDSISEDALTDDQWELLAEISRRAAFAKDYMLLSVYIGGCAILFPESTPKPVRLKVSQVDVEQLCRSGLLNGHYRGGILFFSVSLLAKDRLAARFENDVQGASDGQATQIS